MRAASRFWDPGLGRCLSDVPDGFDSCNTSWQASARPFLWRGLISGSGGRGGRSKRLLETADAMPFEQLSGRSSGGEPGRSQGQPHVRPSSSSIAMRSIPTRRTISAIISAAMSVGRPPYEERPKAKLQESIESNLIGATVCSSSME